MAIILGCSSVRRESCCLVGLTAKLDCHRSLHGNCSCFHRYDAAVANLTEAGSDRCDGTLRFEGHLRMPLIPRWCRMQRR